MACECPPWCQRMTIHPAKMPSPPAELYIPQYAEGAKARLFKGPEGCANFWDNNRDHASVPSLPKVVQHLGDTHSYEVLASKTRGGEGLILIDLIRGQRDLPGQELDPGLLGGRPSGMDDTRFMACHKARCPTDSRRRTSNGSVPSRKLTYPSISVGLSRSMTTGRALVTSSIGLWSRRSIIITRR